MSPVAPAPVARTAHTSTAPLASNARQLTTGRALDASELGRFPGGSYDLTVTTQARWRPGFRFDGSRIKRNVCLKGAKP